MYPSLPSEQYAFQPSLTIIVPGRMYFLTRGIRVAALLSCFSRSIGTINFFFVTLSIPPNNHTLLSRRPCSYFLLPKKVSSISTTTRSPPIGSCFRSQSRVTSKQKLRQSTLLCSDHFKHSKDRSMIPHFLQPVVAKEHYLPHRKMGAL